MADFRRSIFALAALAVVFGATASAQNYNCVASVANPPLLRAEGLTELTGDVVLGCSGGSATLSTTVNVQIFLNTNVTSRLLANGATEALLLVNDPGPGAQVLNTNIYQGTLVASNSVAFLGVILPSSAASPNGVTLRITNVRANANGLGVASASAPPNPVIETISVSSGVTLSNPNQTVGFVTRGLVLATTPITLGSSFLQCNSTGAVVTTGFANPTSAFTINFGEGFPTAFKLQGGGTPTLVPGTVNNTESGLIPATSSGALAGAGQADFGTRVQLTFANVGTGAIVLVPNTVTVSQTVANVTTILRQLTLNVSASSAILGTAAVTTGAAPGTYSELTATGGVDTAVYDITANNPSAIDNFSVPVFLSFIANPGGASPALGTVTVAVSFSPTSVATVASTAAVPVPRFANTGAATNAFSINACATNLLFPFVTNIAGFDTGIAISNTSTDPFSTTAAQAGTCTMNFYGNNSATFTTPNPVVSGSVYTNLLSSIAPGFQGYLIATCRFQYAHGFAFVTDGFGGPGRGLSQGYLALVIPDVNTTGGVRAAVPFPLAGTSGAISSGEQLGY